LDTQGRRVAVISETMAKHYFGDRDPIGRNFLTNGPGSGRGIEIIGVAEDIKYANLREGPSRAFYLPFEPNAQASNFAARTSSDAASLANAIRDAVAEVSQQSRVTNIRNADEALDTTLAPEKSMAQLATIFSTLALTLACIGLYGTLSYAVAERTNEIGVRMALGARAQNVIAMLLTETSVVIGAGLAIGLLAALALTQTIARFLFGLTPSDPFTITIAAVLLLIAAACAAYLPARRASRVDPLVALRHE
jgi:ABC-type antimicrobial peptide transport system permease subunit